MPDFYGRVIKGSEDTLRGALDKWRRQAVDLDLTGAPPAPPPARERTIARPVSVTGAGTFLGKARRTLYLEPSDNGWWFDRRDLPDCLPTEVSIRNVWTTGDVVSNIVLRSGSPSNYIRMVEHMVALKLGLGLDHLMIRMDSGDPPLFDRGSLDLIEAIESAGFRELDRAPRYVTVREPVVAVSSGGGFLVLEPCRDPQPALVLDCAIDFPTAIGRQRIRIPAGYDQVRQGAVARTNTSATKIAYCKTIGRIFADVRNLGYTRHNLQIAGKFFYWNEPRLRHNGKALEAAWHRAVLDLLCALALVNRGRFVGRATSYKAGHHLDVQMVTQLYRQDLLTEFHPADSGKP